MAHTEFVVAAITIPVIVGLAVVLLVLLPYWEELPDRSSFIGMDISVLPERGAYVYLACYFISASNPSTLWYGNELPDTAWVQWKGSPPHPHAHYEPPKHPQVITPDSTGPLLGRMVFEADEEMRNLTAIIRWDRPEFCLVHSASDGITTYRVHP